LVEVVIPRLQLGAGVDAAAVVAGQVAVLLAVAVGDLDLVDGVELHAGVGPPGDQELDVDLDVAERLPGDQVTGAAPGAVDQDALAGLEGQPARVLGVQFDAVGLVPALGGLPERQALLAGQLDPAVLGPAGGAEQAEDEEGGPG